MSPNNRVRLTPMQKNVLLAVWPRLQKQPPPNCTQLIGSASSRLVASGYLGYPLSSIIGFLDRLAKKGVLRWWRQGQARLWAPGPMSDYLQEQGVLP